MAGFTGSSGGGGGGGGTVSGQLMEFPILASAPTGWLTTVSAQTLLQATYPELYGLYGLIANESITGTFTENTSANGVGTFNNVAGNASNWVIVGNSGLLYTSGADPSGTFTSRTSGSSSTLRIIITDGTTWATSGDGTDIFTATDPTSTWTEQTAVFSQSMYAGHYAAGVWVMVGTNGHIWTATDPTGTWTENTAGIPNSTDDLRCIHYHNGVWATGSTQGYIWTATDPTGTWTRGPADLGGDPVTGLAHNGTYWIAVISAPATSTWTSLNDGGTWQENYGTPQLSTGIVCDTLTGHCVASGTTSSAAYLDAIATATWLDHTSLTAETNNFTNIGQYDRYVVLVGNDGTVWTRNSVSYNLSTHFYVPAVTAHSNTDMQYLLKSG